MIEALDHIVLGAAPLAAAVAASETLLGRRCQDGAIQLANVRLELRAAEAGEGLAGLAFAVPDLDKAESLLQRRALAAVRGPGGLELARPATHGVPITIVQRRTAGPIVTSPLADAEANAAVSGLDHVVIRSPDPERAIALYAGRLGLSLRLDRSEPAWGARLLFLRCGDLIVEVAHDLKAGIGDGPDRLWGLSWRVPDIAAAHARLHAAGVAVSDIRAGRRPGTRVITVKSHTTGVPTLLLERA